MLYEVITLKALSDLSKRAMDTARIGFKMLKNPIIGIVPDKKLSRQITMDDKKRKSRRSIFEVRTP